MKFSNGNRVAVYSGYGRACGTIIGFKHGLVIVQCGGETYICHEKQIRKIKGDKNGTRKTRSISTKRTK